MGKYFLNLSKMIKCKLHFTIFYIRLSPVRGAIEEFFAMKAYIHNQAICEEVEHIDISFIPASLRRRLSQIEKIALYLLNGSAPQQGEFRCVFASRWGEWQRTAKLILQLCAQEEISPWGFSTSVHNATVGLFSLIRKNKESYTTVAADELTLEMGILESLITEYPVLFVFAEEDCPKIYEPKMKNPQKSCGMSFFLSREKSDFQVEVDFVKNETDISLAFETAKQFLQGKISEIKTKNFTLKRIFC